MSESKQTEQKSISLNKADKLIIQNFLMRNKFATFTSAIREALICLDEKYKLTK